MFRRGDKVVVKEGGPGRFARYAGLRATIEDVSAKGRVLELRWEDGNVHGFTRDWLGPEHVEHAS